VQSNFRQLIYNEAFWKETALDFKIQLLKHSKLLIVMYLRISGLRGGSKLRHVVAEQKNASCEGLAVQWISRKYTMTIKKLEGVHFSCSYIRYLAKRLFT
jgi:hypothetical protein